MAKNVISFKLEGDKRFPVWVDSYPLEDILTGVSISQVKFGNKYLAISIDSSIYYLPTTVEIFATKQDCITALSGAELLTQEVPGTTEVNPLPEAGWTSRALTSEEIIEIVDVLFSRI